MDNHLNKRTYDFIRFLIEIRERFFIENRVLDIGSINITLNKIKVALKTLKFL